MVRHCKHILIGLDYIFHKLKLNFQNSHSTKEIKLKGSSKKASNSVNAKLHRLMEARKNRPPEEKKKFYVAGNFTADR